MSCHNPSIMCDIHWWQRGSFSVKFKRLGSIHLLLIYCIYVHHLSSSKMTGLGNESWDFNMHPVYSSRLISYPYKGLYEVFCCVGSVKEACVWFLIPTVFCCDNVGTVTGVVMFQWDPDTTAPVDFPNKVVPYAHLSHHYQTPFAVWSILLI